AAGLSPLAEAAVSPGAKRMLTVDVRLHRPEDVGTVTAWLGQRNVAIAGSSGRKIRIYVLEDAPALTDLSSLPEVHSFEEYVAPKLFNDRARDIMTINRAGGPALPY